jgi:hypothetical protein
MKKMSSTLPKGSVKTPKMGNGPKAEMRPAKKAFGSSVNLGKGFDNHEKCVK